MYTLIVPCRSKHCLFSLAVQVFSSPCQFPHPLAHCYSHLNSGTPFFSPFFNCRLAILISLLAQKNSTFFNRRLAIFISTLARTFFQLFSTAGLRRQIPRSFLHFLAFFSKALLKKVSVYLEERLCTTIVAPKKLNFYTKIQETSIKDKQYQSAFCLFL